MKKKIITLLFIFTLGGIFGFIYETFFYRIDLGYFVKRGTTTGPWIPIYGFGSIFLTLLCNKFKDKPLLVFLLSGLICGTLEYFTGMFFWEVKHTRLWDYNTEILNFGNINGYICLRSILFFAISGLFLIKIVLPIINKIKDKKSFNLTLIPGILFIIDILYNLMKGI